MFKAILFAIMNGYYCELFLLVPNEGWFLLLSASVNVSIFGTLTSCFLLMEL